MVNRGQGMILKKGTYVALAAGHMVLRTVQRVGRTRYS